MEYLHTSKKETFFYYLPRALAIAFILFLGIFALDMFGPGQPIWYMIGGFLLHLIPNYLLLIALVLAWRNEFSGGIAFLLFGVVFTLFFQTYLFWPNFLLISFPIFLIGGLFLLHGHYTKNKIAS